MCLLCWQFNLHEANQNRFQIPAFGKDEFIEHSLVGWSPSLLRSLLKIWCLYFISSSSTFQVWITDLFLFDYFSINSSGADNINYSQIFGCQLQLISISTYILTEYIFLADPLFTKNKTKDNFTSCFMNLFNKFMEKTDWWDG